MRLKRFVLPLLVALLMLSVGVQATVPDLPDAESVTFVYLSDPQLTTNQRDAIMANVKAFSARNPEFVYIAGDLTDGTTKKAEWDLFAEAFKGLTIAAAQGNHDSALFGGRLSMPGHNDIWALYAFDCGPARFIVLNTGNPLGRQTAFLRSQAEAAKAAGKWVIVGFHIPAYTGAAYVAAGEVNNVRQALAPLLAELDVDAVLQGHDHVLSRGFVDGQGHGVKPSIKIGDRAYVAEKPANAPLYYVGNCASAFKFYQQAAYSAGNLLEPNYEFLELSSAAETGSALNPDGPCSWQFRGPTYTMVTVTADSISFETYMIDMRTYKEMFYDALTLYRPGTMPSFTPMPPSTQCIGCETPTPTPAASKMPSLQPAPTPTPPALIPGDINGDGQVDINDILLVRDLIFGIKEQTPEHFAAISLLVNNPSPNIDVILAVRDVIFGT